MHWFIQFRIENNLILKTKKWVNVLNKKICKHNFFPIIVDLPEKSKVFWVFKTAGNFWIARSILFIHSTGFIWKSQYIWQVLYWFHNELGMRVMHLNNLVFLHKITKIKEKYIISELSRKLLRIRKHIGCRINPLINQIKRHKCRKICPP